MNESAAAVRMAKLGWRRVRFTVVTEADVFIPDTCCDPKDWDRKKIQMEYVEGRRDTVYVGGITRDAAPAKPLSTQRTKREATWEILTDL